MISDEVGHYLLMNYFYLDFVQPSKQGGKLTFSSVTSYSQYWQLIIIGPLTPRTPGRVINEVVIFDKTARQSFVKSRI